MTAERTTEEWGRVAVSLPGWRWMPGMVIGGEESLRHRRIGDQWNMRCAMLDPRRQHVWPDPDDPATAGCLLALLGPDVNVLRRKNRTVVTIITDNLDFGHYPQGRGSSIGRACIAAAEALGRWPGGDS